MNVYHLGLRWVFIIQKMKGAKIYYIIIVILLYYFYCYIGKDCLDAFVEKMNKIIVDLETFREKNDVNDK